MLGLKKITSHFSLLIIGLGAICFLLTNIILREVLTEEDYGYYSLLITYISMVYLFGLLGFEQVFVRFSNSKSKNEIHTQKIQLKIIGFTVSISTILLTLIYLLFFQNGSPIHPVLLFLAFLALAISPILFNIFRLNSDFSVAQLIANGWKIGMFFLAIAFFLLKSQNLQLFFVILLLIILSIVVIAVFYIKRKIRFVFNHEISRKEAYLGFSLFFISISSFSLVMFADRFIIESKFGTLIFGDYFYLTNFVLAPFSLLQNYVGFKQVVYFKENFSLEGFKKFNNQILMMAIALSLLLVLMLIVVVYVDLLNFDFLQYKSIIFLLLILGIVRLHSSSILPAFEVKTSLESLKKANWIVISLSLLVSLIIIYFIGSLEGIIIGFTCIWLIRSLVYRYLLIQQVKKEK